MCDEQYDVKWYIDSGCSRHMTGRKENLRDYRSLENARVVKFGNNHKCQVKGYGKVTNGNFTVNRVAYVEGLQHNLISVSQLVVGTGNQVVFNEEGSIISNVKTNEILLKSKRYGDMFTLDIKPIVGKPAVCLLSKASNDLSWLWHRRLSHLNFRNINKLVPEDLVRGLPVLKFDNDSLCAACEQGKQHRKGHPIVIDSKIVDPLELLHIDLCGPSTFATINKKRYILVVVDDFSRFMWVFFLRLKSEVAQTMIDFIKRLKLV